MRKTQEKLEAAAFSRFRERGIPAPGVALAGNFLKQGSPLQGLKGRLIPAWGIGLGIRWIMRWRAERLVR